MSTLNVASTTISPLNAFGASTTQSNFSGNAFWYPPNMSHSVFSAHIVDRIAYKYSDWIINTGATNSLLTTITSTLHSFVYLPNGEKALVTHIGTIQVSNTLTLYGVLCVPSFSFNLILGTQLTRVTLCCLIFLSSFCFI